MERSRRVKRRPPREGDTEVCPVNGFLQRPDYDPVCGRQLTREQALLTTEIDGRSYLFCSERCRMLFSVRPGWFLERMEPSYSRSER
jgi:YHS domain-containing protein